MNMNPIQQLITEKYEELTPGLIKVATFLLEEPVFFSQESAATVGKEINVSETTVIRLCHTLGFKGFKELQQEIRQYIYQYKNQLVLKDQNDGGEFYEKVMREDIIHIQETMAQIDSKDYEEAVNQLVHAKHVCIVGSYNSFSIAHWLWFNLCDARENVHLLQPGTDNIPRRFEYLSNDSVIVACSFRRYALETLWIAEEAKKKNISVISITDSPIAPIKKHSDILFSVNIPESKIMNNIAPVYSLLNAILTKVMLNEQTLSNSDDKELQSYRLKKFFV